MNPWLITQYNGGPMWVMRVPASGENPQGLTHTYDIRRAFRFLTQSEAFSFMQANGIQFGPSAWQPQQYTWQEINGDSKEDC